MLEATKRRIDVHQHIYPRRFTRDETCLVLCLTYEKQNRCNFTMGREERLPCGAGAACTPSS